MKNLRHQNGFTLIEVLITLGLIAIVAVIVSVVDINNFRGDSFRTEVSTIGTALQTARANSFNNINQKKHGVAFNPPGVTGYVIFEGDNYTNRGWLSAGDIRVGDTLTGVAGAVKVLSIERSPVPSYVYNFTTFPNHTYFAGGVLVHNIKQQCDFC
jgi:prepilin-type N-terminal cleavage/methylation domain-containing protein